jgi:YbbR domain-containing protein
MTRLVGFVVHNWPLKLAAILLATFLYAGLVLSQNARVWPGPIPIQVQHQPTSAFIVNDLGSVTSVRYFAPVGVAEGLSSSAFLATVDLAGVNVDAGRPILANVTLQGPTGVNILDYKPRQVYVQLDPLQTQTVPIHVTHGIVPEGLTLDPPQISQSTATVSGPASVVMKVVALEARVQIQASGIDVDQLVDLVAVDGRGEVLSPVQISPASVRVRIPVGSPVTTKSVPVSAQLTGSPADGFAVGTVTVTPLVATVTGEASTLAGLTTLQTSPIDISGATETVVRTVNLILPSEVRAVGSDSVEVTVTLRPTDSSRNFSAGLVVVGADTNRTYTVGVTSVIVTLGGGDQALNQVDASSFTATINVAGLGPGSHEVDIQVTAPEGLKVLGVSPPRATVLVGEVATPPPTPSPTPTSPPTLPPSTSFEPATPEPATPEPSVSGAAGTGEPSPSGSPTESAAP